jgi:hypothetical protein
MAYSTLDALRTGLLNVELGLPADTDNAFGTTTERNTYLRLAFMKLWPTMARFKRADVAVVEDANFYDLTSVGLRDVERIQRLDASGYYVEDIRSWDVQTDETSDPVTMRLTVTSLSTVLPTLRIWGYARYKVPASGTDTCDLPPDLEYVVSAGARAEAYRARMNSYAAFERLRNENRANALSAAEIMELFRQAVRDFDQYRSDNRRAFTGAKRAKLSA